MKITQLLVLFAISAPLALGGCRATVPVTNVPETSYGSATYSDARKLTLSDYEKAIVRAGSYRGWIMKPIAPGQLEATNVVRGKHTVVVDIVFNTETYSIKYKDSKNMDWDAATRTIHPNYNTWVKLLEADIKAEIQRLHAS